MMAADFLKRLRCLPFGKLADLTGEAPFLVIAPHADDETLGCGGLLHAACAAGLRPRVVILTDGTGSHPRSRLYPPSRLAALRRAEARAATARLGLPPEDLHFLDLPDTAAPSAGPDFERAVADLRGMVAQSHARSVFVTWVGDPHCDHEAGFAMARAVARAEATKLWAYPIWSWHLDPATETAAQEPEGLRFDITPYLGAKRQAIGAYASQMTDLVADDPEGFRFSAHELAPFLADAETFIRVPT